MTLHLISKNMDLNNFLSILGDCKQKMSLLFIGEGCYCLSKKDSLKLILSKNIKIFVLKEDFQARGINILNYMEYNKIKFIDYDDFVDLTLEHPKIVSW